MNGFLLKLIFSIDLFTTEMAELLPVKMETEFSLWLYSADQTQVLSLSFRTSSLWRPNATNAMNSIMRWHACEYTPLR